MPNGAPNGLQENLDWLDEHHLRIGATNFFLTLDWEIADTTESTPENFLLVKSRPIVETIFQYLPERIDSMVEFGIFKGGSIALYEELFQPKRLVGVDIKPDRVAALDEYLERRSATDRVRLYYGIDQGDAEALEDIARENFFTEPLDLVVDDGSHRYGPTKTTLNHFLPLVRPGGIYLIEDWGWAHWRRHRPDSGQFDDQQNPLTKLIFEVVMLAASHGELVSHVLIDPSRAFIVRGWESMATYRDFDIGDEYRTNLWKFDFAQAMPSVGSSVLDGAQNGLTKSGTSKNLPSDLVDRWRRAEWPSIPKKVPRSVASWVERHVRR
jgi:SAM-dependent methyltransferase